MLALGEYDAWTTAAMITSFAALLVVAYGCNITNRWKLRHIPGPPPSLFLGNLGQVQTAGGMHKFMAACAQKYGHVFTLFVGRMMPCVAVTDPELVKELHGKALKDFNARGPSDLNINKLDPASEAARMDDESILFAKPRHWAGLRSACDPLFQTASLKSYVPVINTAADALVSRVEASGDVAMNLSDLFGAMTLDVVGQAAFGVDFGAQAGGKRTQLQESLFRFFQPPDLFFQLLHISVPHLRTLWWSIAAFIGESRLLAWWTAVPYIFGVMEALLASSKVAYHVRATAPADASRTGTAAKGKPSKRLDLLGVEASMARRWDANKARGRAAYAGQAPATHSLIHRLAGAQHKLEGRPLTDMEILCQAHVFVLAGYETTAAVMAYVLYESAWDPRIQEAMQAEVDALKGRAPDFDDLPSFKYIEAVIMEAMRMYPPASPLITRRCNTLGPAQLGPYLLPQGTTVMINAYGMHHDPANFPHPEIFKPERFLEGHPDFSRHHPYAYVPFGVGPRKCVGYKLAMEEATLALVRLLQRFSFSVNAYRHPARQLELQSFITLQPKAGIWLHATPRSQSA